MAFSKFQLFQPTRLGKRRVADFRVASCRQPSLPAYHCAAGRRCQRSPLWDFPIGRSSLSSVTESPILLPGSNHTLRYIAAIWSSQALVAQYLTNISIISKNCVSRPQGSMSVVDAYRNIYLQLGSRPLDRPRSFSVIVSLGGEGHWNKYLQGWLWCGTSTWKPRRATIRFDSLYWNQQETLSHPNYPP